MKNISQYIVVTLKFKIEAQESEGFAFLFSFLLKVRGKSSKPYFRFRWRQDGKNRGAKYILIIHQNPGYKELNL